MFLPLYRSGQCLPQRLTSWTSVSHASLLGMLTPNVYLRHATCDVDHMPSACLTVSNTRNIALNEINIMLLLSIFYLAGKQTKIKSMFWIYAMKCYEETQSRVGGTKAEQRRREGWRGRPRNEVVIVFTLSKSRRPLGCGDNRAELKERAKSILSSGHSKC